MAQSVLGTTVTPNLFLSGFGSNTRNVNDHVLGHDRSNRTLRLDLPIADVDTWRPPTTYTWSKYENFSALVSLEVIK